MGETAKVVAARDLAAGEDVMIEDIAGITGYEPRVEDVGVPHVTAFAHRDGRSLVFEFSSGHPRKTDFLERARQFLITAREAARADRAGPFVDNAFSACELLAKTELLSSQPTVDLVLDRVTHRAVARPYNAWANLGNTDRRYARVLGRLAELRRLGRYVEKELTLEKDDVLEILQTLEAMETHVTRVVERKGRLGGSDAQMFFAKRSIRAGSLVMSDDVTIFPPKGAKEPDAD